MPTIQAGIFKTTKECVSSIVADAGPAGFYRGYLTTVAREVPFSAIQVFAGTGWPEAVRAAGRSKSITRVRQPLASPGASSGWRSSRSSRR
jgi:hypothetical protein